MRQSGNQTEWPDQPFQAEWEHNEWAQDPNTAEDVRIPWRTWRDFREHVGRDRQTTEGSGFLE